MNSEGIEKAAEMVGGRDRLAGMYRDELERRDIGAFIEANLWIRDKEGHIIRFVPNAIQRRYRAMKAEAILAGKPRRFLVLKYRRGGITTWEQAQSFHLACTRAGQEVVTLTHEQESTEKVFQISTLFYDRMPAEKRPRRLAVNKRELRFPLLRSTFYTGTAGARSFGRGTTLQRVHGSEVSRWPGGVSGVRDLMAGLTEAASHGEIVLESTANGMGNWYHQTWQEATKGANEWTPIFLAWYMDPNLRIPLEEGERIELTEEEKAVAGRYGLDLPQIKWRRDKARALKSLFPQEYPEDPVTAFVVTGILFFEKEILLQLMPLCADPLPSWGGAPPELRDGFQVWHPPEEGADVDYYIGADVSEGIPGGNLSCAGVVDRRGRQCAALHGYWRPEVFGRKCVALARWYGEALLGIEANNHGHSALNTARNVCRYPRIYVHQDYTRRGGIRKRLGWRTTPETRPVLLDDLATAIHEEHMEVNHRDMAGECFTFMDDGSGKYRAREGCHDDTIFAWGIAWQMRQRGMTGPWVSFPDKEKEPEAGKGEADGGGTFELLETRDDGP